MESCVRGGAGGRGAETGALPLPPPPRLAAVSSSNSSAAAAATIRAHLARTGSGVDCQASPRSLLSRILLRGGGDGGSSGSGFGCRVRLPRRYGSGGREERKDGGASEQGDTIRVKVVERPPPEMPIETPRSSLGRRKPEEELASMNLGLGASLVLLLSKSAVELNKMVELRAQMEALVSEIRQAAQRKLEERHSVPAAPAPASNSTESNGSSATTTNVKDPIAFPATDADAASNCSRTTDTARPGVVINRMEAELQAELNRLQRGSTVHGDQRDAPMQGLELPLLKVKTKSDVVPDSPSRSCVDDGEESDDDEEEYEEAEDEKEDENEEDKSPPHGGVSARALERRLHELLQKRQQDRIVELESALNSAQRLLHEKEREVVWWRDAAKLVTHRRDESRRSRIIVASSSASSGRDFGAKPSARARS